MKASGPARPLAVFAKLQTRILRPVYRDDGCLRRYTSCSRERPPVPTWMKTDRAAFSRATVSRLNERAKRWNGTLGKADGEDGPPTNSVDRKLSAEGQALYKRFVPQDPNNSSAKILNDSEKKWKRAQDMDAYAFQLIRAHEGSLELEQEYERSGNNLKVGAKSSNLAVEHLGAGVFLEKDTPGIDNDSREENNSATITRIDLRAVANDALKQFNQPTKNRNVAVIGYPGIGKTRGGLTYALQTLLWRGEAVLRVGYKDGMVYAFLPNEEGTYEVWSTTTKDWPESKIAASTTAYALIDPPEGELYTSIAPCKVLKFVSNNAKKHYDNFDNDGTVLIAAMPTMNEMLAMTPVLWNENTTPITNDDIFQGIDAKKDEVRDRCALVGCSPRAVFSGVRFVKSLAQIIKMANDVAKESRTKTLADLYFGVTTFSTDKDASSITSRLYDINPVESSRQKPLLTLKPLVSYLWRLGGEQQIAGFDGRRAFEFEDLCGMLIRSATVGETQLPARTLVLPKSRAETSKVIRGMLAEGQKVVVAYGENYPVLDFATCRFAWYNAKVGSTKPTVNAGAFITLMLELGLAEKVDGKLVMKDEHTNAKITLTMLRNQDTPKSQQDDVFESSISPNHGDMSLVQVREVFLKHVKVEYLNMSKWKPSVYNGLEQRMSTLLQKYVKVPPRPTHAASPIDAASTFAKLKENLNIDPAAGEITIDADFWAAFQVLFEFDFRVIGGDAAKTACTSLLDPVGLGTTKLIAWGRFIAYVNISGKSMPQCIQELAKSA